MKSMKRLIAAFILIVISGLNCGEPPQDGECRELLNPVEVSDPAGEVWWLKCECWTHGEWLASCPDRNRF